MTKKETNEVTKKEDNNENGIECLFRSTLLITIIASVTIFLFKVSYHDKRPFVTALCACTHTNPGGQNRKTTIQQEEEEDDER